jgi:hypothetical protein
LFPLDGEDLVLNFHSLHKFHPNCTQTASKNYQLTNPDWRLLAIIKIVRVHYRPPDWTHPEPHKEEVKQFPAMLRFKQKSQVEKLSEFLN